MPSGSETIIVVEARPAVEEDWEGDPVEGAGERVERAVEGCMLIPRMSKDDPTLVLDGYQIVMFDVEQTPPKPEDSIKIRGEDFLWDIDGNVGDFGKSPENLKAFMFVIERPR